MEGFLVLIGLTLLAVPVAIVYLLVKVARQQRFIELLHNKVGELIDRQQASQASNESQQSQPVGFQPDQTQEPPVATPATASKNLSSAQPVTTPPTKETPEPDSPIPVVRQSAANIKRQTVPAETSVSRQPDLGDKIGQYIKNYFTEGNLIVRVGVIVLFFGVAFLLKYAAEHNAFPIELRLTGVAVGGIVLLMVGWRLRFKRRVYALIMQGAGIGVLYLTMYSALRLYQLLPAATVIAMMLLMVSLAAILAILQNARSLAVLAAVGGFLAPILTSTGQGDHITLFSYYLILNIGILVIAWFKSWRMLNLIGFAFTFAIGAIWGVYRYRPEQFVSTEIFLVMFFLFYVAIALLYARRQPPKLRGLVDASLVFGTPLIAFSLQAGLVHRYEYGLAWSAFAAGAFYLLLALQCWRFGGQNYRLLSETMLVLGVIFASLTIPFALDGNGIAAAWALEGAGILWVSVRQRHQLGVAFGILLQLGGGMALLAEHTLKGYTQPVFNSVFAGAVLVALAGLFSSYYLLRKYRATRSWEYQANLPLLLWGLCWWFGNGITEIIEYQALLPWLNALHATLAFVALSVAILGLLEKKLDWHALRYATAGLTLAMGWLFFQALDIQAHPFGKGGVLAWPFAFVVLYILLWQRDRSSEIGANLSGLLPWLHIAGATLLVAVLTAELQWLVGDKWNLGSGWYAVSLALIALLACAAVLRFSIWPIAQHPRAYQYGLMGLWLIYLLGWMLAVNAFVTGEALPLPYLPILNPVDIVQAMVLLTLFAWWRQPALQASFAQWQPRFLLVFASLTFIWLNAVLLRTLYHWANVPLNIDGIMDSALAQACLSIFWTLLGLSVMIMASRRYWRNVWIAAAILLGVVVLKLFSVDLSDRNTLESIISFIVVGALLLVIGYYSPIPPGEDQADETRRNPSA